MKTIEFKTDEEMIDWTFRQALPKYGFKIREPQIELCKQMTKALDNHQISLSEAEVGTGKTYAYLVACIVNRHFREDDLWSRMNYPHSYDFTLTTPMPFVIATSSIELQNAIINDYIPKLSQILMKEKIITKPLTVALRKGKRNYICDEKLLDYIRDLQGSKKPPKNLGPLIEVATNDEIDLDNIAGLSNYDKRRISVNRCPKDCDHKFNCAYYSFQEENLNPDILFQVCNHNYYIADLNHKRTGLKNLLPCYRGVIIDEAHKFEDALNGMYKKKLHKNDLLITLGRISKKLEGTPYYKRVKEIRKHAIHHINLLYDSFNNQIDSDELNVSSQFAVKITKKHIFRIKLIASYFTELEKMLMEKYKSRCPYKNIISEIKEVMVSFVCNKINIHWIERNKWGSFDKLYSLPLGINKTYQNQIWQRSLPVILTSGTLSINNDFHYIRNKLGLDIITENKYDETSKKSPFDYNRNCLIYLSESTITPKQKDEVYIKSISNEIIKLTDATKGRSLILFTSYKVLHKVHEHIKDKVNYPIIVSDRGNRAAVDKFKKTTNGILLSTDAWEGVDIEGELLSSLIITKLPFPIPNIDQKLIKKEYNDFFTYLQSEIIPAMQIKLKQGAGRLIRSETDRGVICILDNRYQKETLAALPKCRVTNDIDTISLFLDSQNTENSTYRPSALSARLV